MCASDSWILGHLAELHRSLGELISNVLGFYDGWQPPLCFIKRGAPEVLQ